MKLCAPAIFYLVVSLILVFFIAMQNNVNNTDFYCFSNTNCQMQSMYTVLVIKVIFIFFWTFILNLICEKASPILSWILVFLPLVIFILIMLSVLVPFFGY